jgi:hypothetical protein
VEPEAPQLELRRRLELRLSEVRQLRTPVEGDWRQLTRFLMPERGRYLVQSTGRRPRATSSSILDPCGSKAHRRLAAFLMAGITNPSLPWFGLGVGDAALDESKEIRGYLDECRQRMLRVFAAGTFYPALHQAFEELAGFGTCSVLALPDYEDVLWFYPLTAGEFYLGLNARQEVDELFREYTLSVSQLVEQFGIEQVSTTVKSLHESRKFSAEVIVCHAIVPNRDRQSGMMGWRGRPYLGVYYERAHQDGVLKVEGFDHRPFVAPRWHALAGEPYGTGPGHKALPDIKSLQAGVRQMREAGEKLVNPPLQGEARHQNEYVGQLPGDINWLTGVDANSHSGLKPIFTVPPNVSVLAEEVQGYRRTVEETLYNDLILAISQMEGVQPRNEMEIVERRNEKMLMLGPMLERFYIEALAPLIRITFSRMQAVGIMPKPPESLHGRQIVPKFVSVLAQAAKAIERFGGDGLREALNVTRAGNHPAVVRAFIQIGKALGDAEGLSTGKPVVGPPKTPEQAARSFYNSNGGNYPDVAA